VRNADVEPLPEGDEKVAAVRSMFDTIAPRYDLVNRVMTFRMDVGWRRTTIEQLDLSAGSVVLDLAAGTGDFCRELTRGGLRPLGFDLSYGMLAAARTEAPLVQADALRSQGKHTPFSGYEMPGQVRATLVGGQVAFERD